MKRQRVVTINEANNPQVIVRTTGSKRPVDKNLIGIVKSGLDGTQSSTTLATVTFPCTIVGLRWDLQAITDAGTGHGHTYWAIVVVRDGRSANTLTNADGTTFYEPEQDVMAFGITVNPPNGEPGTKWSGDTKTMRKMMGGDTLQFICRGESTNTTEYRGTIQFFCKT